MIDTKAATANSARVGSAGPTGRREPTAARVLAVGRADAPVVMIEYSDFQCAFCGQFARKTEPELLRSYVDKGLLRIEWRNFSVFGEESEQAALAGWAAGQQKKFWEFHDVAYSNPRERNAGEFSAGRTADAVPAGAKAPATADTGRGDVRARVAGRWPHAWACGQRGGFRLRTPPL